MTGRPPKLTPELLASVVEGVKAGNYAEIVAQANGVTVQTFHNWMRWGQRGTEPYATFFEAVTRARAQAELDLLSVAAAGDDKGYTHGPAKAAAWVLERTRGNRYAPRVNLKVEQELKEFLDVAERVLAPEDFGALLEAYDAWVSGREAAADQGTAGSGEPTEH